MTRANPFDYTITVRRRTLDGQTMFEASVAELPDVRDYGDSFAEAYEMVIETISSLAESAEAEGSLFPQPLPETDVDYSGRVTLRLPKSVHRRAAEIASAQGVSFNAYLSSVITADVARTDATATVIAQCRLIVDQFRGLLLEQSSRSAATAGLIDAITGASATIGGAESRATGALDIGAGRPLDAPTSARGFSSGVIRLFVERRERA